MPALSDRSLGSLAAAGAAMLFGSAYVATAVQLRGFTPLGGALWRAALAVGILVLVLLRSLVRRRARPGAGRSSPPPRGRLVRLLVLGGLGGLVFIIGMNLAVSAVGATITAFVAGLYAILAALFAPAVLHERLERRAIAGFIVALVGTMLLAELNPGADTVEGLLAGGVAAVSYGLYLVLIRRWSAAIEVGPVGISLATSATSVAGLTIVLALLDPGAALPEAPPSSSLILATAWLAVVTALGPLLATAALRRIEASLASSLLLLNPITATVLAILLLGERPSPIQFIGACLVLLGIAAATGLAGALEERRSARLVDAWVASPGPPSTDDR